MVLFDLLTVCRSETKLLKSAETAWRIIKHMFRFLTKVLIDFDQSLKREFRQMR